MILRVKLEMLGQVANSLAQNRNLHLRTPGIGIVCAIACDNFGFLFRCQHLCATPLIFLRIHFLSVCTKNNMARRFPSPNAGGKRAPCFLLSLAGWGSQDA